MVYENAQLHFFCRALEKMRIQSHIVHHENIPAESLDLGLRKHLGREADYDESMRKAIGLIKEDTVYKLTDPYCCKYIFMILPGTESSASLIIGPYISHEMSKDRLLEEAERMQVPASEFKNLEDFYRSLPVLTDDSRLMAMVNTLAEELWGSECAYQILDLVNDTDFVKIKRPEWKAEEDSAMHIRLMEQRYAYENELLDKVSKGLWHRAGMMLNPSVFSHLENRTTDPVRNQKNYCIVCNTLLRKAAERGGVHPVHLDRLSSIYARQIELVSSVSEGDELIQQMCLAYSRLVHKCKLQDYSALIQKVITYIEVEISSDLSLRKLANLHNVSPEYLSTLFHKETQTTLTQFINERRIELGANMLQTTSLQIQTIAECCGFPDAGYFAKLFKKRYGASPKAFRERKEQFNTK